MFGEERIMSEENKETIGFCNICSKRLTKCKCNDEDFFKYYHALRLKTFGIKQVLTEVCTYISLLAKRIEKLENKDKKND